MSEKKDSTTLVARCYKGGSCAVKFTPEGHKVLWDDRAEDINYLSPEEDTADYITDGCRDSLMQYAASRQRPAIGNAARWRYSL